MGRAVAAAAGIGDFYNKHTRISINTYISDN